MKVTRKKVQQRELRPEDDQQSEQVVSFAARAPLPGLLHTSRELWLAGLLTLLAGSVYFRTLAPGIVPGDGSELITASHVLGVAHPTGYPLFLILGKVFQLVFPFYEISWRMNVFTLVTALGAVVLMFFSLNRLFFMGSPAARYGANSTQLFASLILSLSVAFSLSFWQHAVSANVYALNALLSLLIFYSYLGFCISPCSKYLKLSLLWMGLGLANHTLSIAVSLLIVVHYLYIAFRRRFGLSFKLLLRYSTLLLPGLSFYLYIPIRAAMHPPINWGYIHDFASLFHYLSRKDYWSKAYVTSFSEALKACLHYLTQPFAEYTVPLFGAFLVILVMGLVLTLFSKEEIKQNKPEQLSSGVSQCQGKGVPLWQVTLVVGCFFATNATFLILHGRWEDIYIWNRYFIMGSLCVVLLVGIALARILERLARASRFLVLSMLLGLSFWECKSNFQLADYSEQNYLSQYIERFWSLLPEGSILFAEGDSHLFPIVYDYYVQGKRNDVRLIKFGMGEFQSLEEMLRVGKPVYFTHRKALPEDYTLIPQGLFYQLAKTIDASSGKIGQLEGIDKLSWPGVESLQKTDHAHLDYYTRTLIGEFWFRLAFTRLHWNKDAPNAFSSKLLYYIERLENVAWDNPEHLTNVGIFYYKNGKPVAAQDYFERALALDPKLKYARESLAKVLASLRGTRNISINQSSPTGPASRTRGPTPGKFSPY